MSIRVNLDEDAARETVNATHTVSFDHTSQSAQVVAIDHCGGVQRMLELAPTGSYMWPQAIRGSRALGRPGVLFSIEYADGHSIARVARLRRLQAGACPQPVSLFDYSTSRPPRRPPSGQTIVGFDVTIGAYSRVAGRELLLTEGYAKPPSERARTTRRTYFRYLKARGRYVGYRTVLS